MKGKVALITGAAAGIGRATAIAFAREGARVVVSDVNEAGGAETVDLIEEKGGTAIFIRADVADAESVASLVSGTVDAFGGLDFAFNNAGIEGEPSPTAECSGENWDRVIGINLTGVWLCMKREIPVMLERGGGVIVNCASIAGVVGYATMPAYTASKHGVIGLTRTAALEYANQKIRVNAICPGVIETEMIERFAHGDPERRAQLLEGVPVGRLGRPEEIANAVLWLCADDSAFVTGHPLVIDGGHVAR